MDKNTKPLNVRLKPNEQKSSIKKTTRKASLTRKTTKDNKNEGNPKKKKIKHVSFSGVRSDSAHEKLMSAGTLTDKSVRVALSDFLSKYEK